MPPINKNTGIKITIGTILFIVTIVLGIYQFYDNKIGCVEDRVDTIEKDVTSLSASIDKRVTVIEEKMKTIESTMATKGDIAVVNTTLSNIESILDEIKKNTNN